MFRCLPLEKRGSPLWSAAGGCRVCPLAASVLAHLGSPLPPRLPRPHCRHRRQIPRGLKTGVPQWAQIPPAPQSPGKGLHWFLQANTNQGVKHVRGYFCVKSAHKTHARGYFGVKSAHKTHVQGLFLCQICSQALRALRREDPAAPTSDHLLL